MEAGELVKIRTAYELAKNKGDLGHHSDGTTKSLVHWGTHILKLNVDGVNQTFTLGVTPVESGKASATVNALQEHFSELENIAKDLEVAHDREDFQVSRIAGRMSDRAANERAVTKKLIAEKEKLCEQSADWELLDDDEKRDRIQIREWTCASHKIDNMATSMTAALAKHLDQQAGRTMTGAKKVIYEVNKLICEQGRKEYGKGKEFKMFCLSEDVPRGNCAHLLQPIVGNRYIIFLYNSMPTLLSRELVLIYLEHMKEYKTLNRLESSVLDGLMSPTTTAELSAYAIAFFYICQPLLMKGKSVNSPLEMNYFYKAAIMKLAQFVDDAEELTTGGVSLWPGAVSVEDSFHSLITQVHEFIQSTNINESVKQMLQVMCQAGKERLQLHASEHLPGGQYEKPSSRDTEVGQLIGSATNDIVESCFGVLDREQTLCPVRNPMHTSALITAKKDKPVAYVMRQHAPMQEKMVCVAQKRAREKRKEKGTRDQQAKYLYEKTAPEVNALKEQRRQRRAKRIMLSQELTKALNEGSLVTDYDVIMRMKVTELNCQFKLWKTLQSQGYTVQLENLLAGYSTLRVAEKKERLAQLAVANKDTLPQNLITNLPLEDNHNVNENIDTYSSSSEEESDTMTVETETQFTSTDVWVATAFAGGAWYPGKVTRVISGDLADVEYLHPTSSMIPLPANVLFKVPAKRDIFRTDACNVFVTHVEVTPVSSRRTNTYKLSMPIDIMNELYSAFAKKYNIPL